MTDERPALLDYAHGLTERQREHLDRLRAQERAAAPPAEKTEPLTPSQRPLSAAENLDELERDTHAGRVQKIDLRIAPDEKVAWSEAARVRGMSTSEWIRCVLNLAAREVLVGGG
jgi:hypothetical protein